MRYAAVMGTCATAVLAEAICAVAALSRRSLRSRVCCGLCRQMNNLPTAGLVSAVLDEFSFIGTFP